MLSAWFTLTLFSLVCGISSVDASEGKFNGLDVIQRGLQTDCSNSTHRWTSKNGNCFDEEAGPIPFISQKEERPNAFGRYLGGIGLSPRETGCAADERTCWIVNCCQPGETCGAINVGCVASWSTIYTSTTLTSWSTIIDTVTPDSVSYTTATASTTAYITSYHQLTLPGAGLDTVVVTVTTTSTSLILSAYTPPPVTVTEPAPSITSAPDVKRSFLQYAPLPRRSDRTSYTTLTVYITTYYTAYSTSTLASNLLTTTKLIGVSSTATRNQTHYATPTGFTTITQTITSVVPSYAFGSLQPLTKTVTQDLPSSIIAGVSPTDSSGASSQSNPAGAYPPPSSRKLSPGAIAGLVVGLILLVVLLALCIGVLCCIRRRKRREAAFVEKSNRRRTGSLEDVPTPPSPPTPQPAMSSSTPSPPYLRPNSGSPVSPTTSPTMVGAIPPPSRVYHSNGGNGGSRLVHGRKSSRSSIVSITPVPEEDEGEDDLEALRSPSRRNSNDSNRSWGRGYGGRGGYYNGVGARTGQEGRRSGGANSPTNPAFRGVITTTYSDESLIPPHAR